MGAIYRNAYPGDLGLRHYVRHLLFLKPYVLIVVDDIAMEEAAELELRFHPEQPRVEQDGDAFLIQGKRTALRIDPLTPEAVDISAEDVEAEGRREQKDAMFTVRLSQSVSGTGVCP